MKAIFPGSYPPSEEDLTLLWSEGTFAFDTNMLLNFFRYSDDTRKEFIDIVASPRIADRVWIPYHVAVEYHRNLEEVRYEQVAACMKMRASIGDWAKSLRAGDHKKRAGQLLQFAEKLVMEAEDQYRHVDRQALSSQIAGLFDGKVGPEWDERRLAEVYKDGERRFKAKVPPGFRDKSKQDESQYGDLVIWLQILEEAKKTGRPIVFVTDDIKDDWWLRVGGKTVGPLPALRNEMLREAGVCFYMYSGDRFLDRARKTLRRPVRDETVAEVKQVRVDQQRKRQWNTGAFVSHLRQHFPDGAFVGSDPKVESISLRAAGGRNRPADEWQLQWTVVDEATGTRKTFATAGKREELEDAVLPMIRSFHAQQPPEDSSLVASSSEAPDHVAPDR